MTESAHSRIFKEGLLDGQVCLVSGAGSGLGRETALELARLGPAVVPQVLAGCFGHGALDIRDEEGVEPFFERLLERHGRLDVLVNNAGGQFLSLIHISEPTRRTPISYAVFC